MHDPERGGSQVPLGIAILLLLVAGGIAYSEYDARVAAEKDLDEILAAASDGASPSKSKGDAIACITRVRDLCARQEDRLYEILEVTGGADEENPELVVDPAKLKTVQTRFLEALDKGEFVVEVPLQNEKVVIQYGGTRELRGARPELSNIVDVVAMPALRRMFADVRRYSDLYGQALDTMAAKDAAVAALTAERDEWKKRAGQAAAELQALRQR